ncbi:MAG TPA: CDP-alcohol phosphatidyltransferase family protein [bacterium]|nr:CDP-alcohol phosphatidyltransferase family protein [bacterium]
MSKKNYLFLFTVSRAIGAPLLILFKYLGQDTIVFFLILTFSFSDNLDGYLARKYKVTSKLGKVLDNFADMIFVISISIALNMTLALVDWKIFTTILLPILTFMFISNTYFHRAFRAFMSIATILYPFMLFISAFIFAKEFQLLGVLIIFLFIIANAYWKRERAMYYLKKFMKLEYE